MANNKVIYNGQTIIDITPTTAVETDVSEGKVFYKADGSQATGTATPADECDMYVEDATGIQTGDLLIDLDLETKTATYTANGTYTINKSASYDGIDSATVTVSVPTYDGSIS